MTQAQFVSDTYKGKKVFVTGHTGFKGSWLITWLHHMGAIVKGYALQPTTSPSLFLELQGDRFCESVIGDIRNSAKVRQEIDFFQPDFIFHLAAQPLVRYSYKNPVETFEVNIMGTIHVLEAVRALRNKCVCVFVTTDKVYENNEWIFPYRENESLGGYDPYSASKAASEIVISSYRSSYFNDSIYSQHLKSIATARAGNVIGGGDWADDRIIPDLVRAFFGKGALRVRNPHAIRPWQHVLEPLGGYLLLGAKMDAEVTSFNESWNFGPFQFDTLTVSQLVSAARVILGALIVDEGKEPGQPHEANLLKLDISKAVDRLGWLPKYSARESVERTIRWYKANKESNNSVRDLMLSDIHEYIG